MKDNSIFGGARGAGRARKPDSRSSRRAACRGSSRPPASTTGMIDHEHGAFDLETIADLAGWFQATNVSAIVRIHKSFTYLIPQSSIRGSWACSLGRSITPKRPARSCGGKISAIVTAVSRPGDAHRIPQPRRRHATEYAP